MDARMFRSFVKEAMALQADAQTPPDYTMVKVAVAAKFPGLKMASGVVQPPMGGGGYGNHLELGGLGVLAVPSAMELAGHPMSEKHKAMMEVGGLGMLAAPYVHNLAAARSARYAASPMGQKLTQFFRA